MVLNALFQYDKTSFVASLQDANSAAAPFPVVSLRSTTG
jgi:hypothetical protein